MSIILKEPVSLLDRNIQLDIKSLSKTVVKLIAKSVSFKWDEVIEDSPDLADALGLIQSENEIAYVFVITSFLKAFNELVEEIEVNNNNVEQDIEMISFLISERVQKEKLILDDKLINREDFYKSELLNELTNILIEYLQNKEIESYIIDNLKNRFKSYFLTALHKNWLKDSKYSTLLSIIDNETPFITLQQKIVKWNDYYSYLLKQVDLPLFSENFSLNQIYIPLRAKTKNSVLLKTNNEDELYSIVDINDEIISWIRGKDTNDTIRLINGGPGSGKSSFLKILASQLTNDHVYKIIFIPLHLISFTNSLDDSINNYLSTIAGLNFSDLIKENEKFLLIFDGLDELASQGTAGESIARDFSNELQRTLRLHNAQEVKVKAIISGRDIVIQKEKKYLKVKSYELLPYFINDNGQYHDPLALLKEDQRDLWWNRYSNLKNRDVSIVLEQIKSKNLQEITSQPLLNYLVAILLDIGEIQLSEETTINEIYEYLLREVYKRGWENHKTYGPIQSIEYDNFLMILQEISYTAWKSNGRTTNIKSIVEQCKYMGIDHILENFTNSLKIDEKSSLTRLLTAFYFKSNDGLESILDQTFEFTHKSFSDYLIALKTCVFIESLNDDFELSRKMSGRRGKNIYNITEDFVIYFKSIDLNENTVKVFLKNEFHKIEKPSIIKNMLVNILEFIIEDNDIPALIDCQSLEKINSNFYKIFSNILLILEIFCKIDNLKIELLSLRSFGLLQGKLNSEIMGLAGNYLDCFVLSNVIVGKNLMGVKHDYSVNNKKDINEGFFGFNFYLCNYDHCIISFNILSSVKRLSKYNCNFKECKIQGVNDFVYLFIECSVINSSISNIKKVIFNDSILVNLKIENVELVHFSRENTYKDVFVNGVLIDNLNNNELKELGVIFIEEEKEGVRDI